MPYKETKEEVFKILNRLAREKRMEAAKLEKRIGDRPESRRPKLAVRRLREAESDYRRLREFADTVYFEWGKRA